MDTFLEQVCLRVIRKIYSEVQKLPDSSSLVLYAVFLVEVNLKGVVAIITRWIGEINV